MKRLLALLALVLFLWPAAARAAVALCAISGQVFNPDGTPLKNGVVQFNSQVTQVAGSTTIPPSIISTTTDGNGNMAPMSVAQGLFGQFTFCQGQSSTNVGGPGGGCAAPINGLVPINTTGNIQAVIAGTLLPSVGNATVNNLTATNNVNVGGLLETTTLKVDSNATVGGTLNVTGNTTLGGTLTTTGALAGPSLSLTSTACSALTLAQAVITSTPPDNDLVLAAGAHCGGGTWTADANSALVFANFVNAVVPTHNAGWQWMGNTGLTVGSTFTPTLTMSLSTTSALVPATFHTGILRVNSLILDNGTTTAIFLPTGSIVGAAGVVDVAGSAHWNGANFIADATSATLSQSTPVGAGFNWYANSGLTVGNPISWNQLGTLTTNGMEVWGTNPVLILQSNTNTPADVLELLPQNQTQGIGMTWNSIHMIGSLGTAMAMSIDAKNQGPLYLQTINAGGGIFTGGSIWVQNNYHINVQNNGVHLPSLGTCSAGSLSGVSTDNSGLVLFSAAGATSCGMNFGFAFSNYPICVCNLANAGVVPVQCVASANSMTSVTFYFPTAISGSGAYVSYHCMGS